MKINKEDFELTAIIVAITPFIIIYKIVKWIYNCLPYKLAERQKTDEEIRALEKEHGKSEILRNNRVFDEYYYPYPYNENRSEYFEELKKKKKDYTMPDIIIAAEQAFGSICCPIFNKNSEFDVLLLVNSNIYDCQEENSLFGSNAKKYLENRKNFFYHSYDFHWFFHTLQECPDYSQYYVVKTGLKIRFNKILDSEEVKKYIEDFRKSNLPKEQ